MENNYEDETSLQRPTPENNNNYAPETDEEEKGMTWSQFWHMVVKHWVVLVICILVGLAGGVVYGRAIKKPKYQATSQMMTVTNDSELSEASAISLSRSQAQILSVYVTSDEVTEALAKKLVESGYSDYKRKDGSYNSAAAAKLYTASIPTVGESTTTTSIFVNITATASASDLAIAVANYVPQVTIDLVNNKDNKLYSTLGNSVSTLATVNSARDTSTSNATIALIGMLIGAVVGVLYGVIRELSNTHVGSKQELETLTGYKVIGMIPKYDVKDTSVTENEDRAGGK